MISIQYDRRRVTYVGFAMLYDADRCVFFSHQRLWIVAEEGRVSISGDSNRNRLSFEDRLKKIAARIHNPSPAEADQATALRLSTHLSAEVMGQASNSINVPVVTTPGFGIGGAG
jgi:hypothetical protein